VSGKDSLTNKIQELESENKKGKDTIDSLDYQNKFFKAYVRYMTWSTPRLVDPSIPSDQRGARLASAQREFVAMVKKLFDEANALAPGVHRVKFRADKGVDDEVGIVTFDDDLPWRIPPEIKREVHAR
jgi:hypothetical protein